MLGQDLTTRDVAEILRLNRVTVQRLLNEGRIHGYLIGRTWRIPKESLDEFRKTGVRTVGRRRGVVSPSVSQKIDDWEADLNSTDDLISASAVPLETMNREALY